MKSVALTMTLFSYSVPKLGATGFAILANAELVTVVLIGTLVLGEAMTPDRAIGGTLIVAGIVTHVLSRRAARMPSPPPKPERAGMRRGIPERLPAPTSPSPALRAESPPSPP